MLHIHNGDSSAGTAKQSSLPGEQFAFREALICGPTPDGVTQVEWRQIRARHLFESYEVAPQQAERELLAQEQKLATFSDHEEVVLWFEHDLFCQIHLLYLLHWFGQQQLAQTKLSLICVGEFPGKENFRGLGELNARELASLFPGRQQVTRQQLDLGSSGWRAYCSNDPTEIETLLKTETTSLPFLAPALKGHLRRFPSTRNGLGQIENLGLEIIHSGLNRFADLFPRFGQVEPVYGLGDAQFWMTLRRLSDASHPLLKIENVQNAGPELTPAVIREARFEITDVGYAVLKGESDFVELNGIDLWLGGAHISSDRNLWRWNEGAEALIFTTPDAQN